MPVVVNVVGLEIVLAVTRSAMSLLVSREITFLAMDVPVLIPLIT